MPGRLRGTWVEGHLPGAAPRGAYPVISDSGKVDPTPGAWEAEMVAGSNNGAVVLGFYEEVVNGRKLDSLAEVMGDGYVEHGQPRFSGVDGFLSSVAKPLDSLSRLEGRG